MDLVYLIKDVFCAHVKGSKCPIIELGFELRVVPGPLGHKLGSITEGAHVIKRIGNVAWPSVDATNVGSSAKDI